MTRKQQAVARDLLENTGKSVSRAMREAGYAPATANNPQQLTRSKSWQKLMKDHFPDEILMRRHLSLLESTSLNKLVFDHVILEEDIKTISDLLVSIRCKRYIIAREANKTVVYFTQPDNRTQLGALFLAYKVKGKLQNALVSGEKVIAILNSSPHLNHRNKQS